MIARVCGAVAESRGDRGSTIRLYDVKPEQASDCV